MRVAARRQREDLKLVLGTRREAQAGKRNPAERVKGGAPLQR